MQVSERVSAETRDLLFRMLRIAPEARLDVHQVLAHSALRAFADDRLAQPVSAAEYQLLLRNYVLNTRGAEGRDAPEELSRFLAANQEFARELFGGGPQPRAAEALPHQHNHGVLDPQNFFGEVPQLVDSAKHEGLELAFKKHETLNYISESGELVTLPASNKQVEKKTAFFDNIYQSEVQNRESDDFGTRDSQNAKRYSIELSSADKRNAQPPQNYSHFQSQSQSLNQSQIQNLSQSQTQTRNASQSRPPPLTFVNSSMPPAPSAPTGYTWVSEIDNRAHTDRFC